MPPQPNTSLQIDTSETTAVGILPKISIDAFLTSKAESETIKFAARDRRMSKVNIGIHDGGLVKAIEFYGANKTPNLILVEADCTFQELFVKLDKLAALCPPNTKVIVVGAFNDIRTYRDLMEKGVSDYLVSPISDKDLIKSISKTFGGENSQKLGRITAFMGTRGGSGSSTLAHNVAALLAESSADNVLLMDVDYPFGTAALNLNLDNDNGAFELLSNQSNIDDGFLDRISVRYEKKLRVITSGTSLDQQFEIGKDFVSRVVDAIHEGASHAILDLPTSWSDREAEFLKAADDIVLTATPDLSSMKNTKQLVEYCARIRPNDPPPLLVINQVGMPKRPELTEADFGAAVRLKPSILIPFDAYACGKAANNGRTIVESAPKSQTSKAITELASLLGRDRLGSHSSSRLSSLWERFSKRS